MPLSRPDAIPMIVNLVWNTNPRSLLDCGCGFGGMGVLFRQAMDVRWGRVRNWTAKLHGIEINAEYRTPLHDYIYDHYQIGDMCEILPRIGSGDCTGFLAHYDVIYFGDVLEHLEKSAALRLIDVAKGKASLMIISTPAAFASNTAEAERFHNPHEEHKCLLEPGDLPGFVRWQFANQCVYGWSQQ